MVFAFAGDSTITRSPLAFFLAMLPRSLSGRQIKGHVRPIGALFAATFSTSPKGEGNFQHFDQAPPSVAPELVEGQAIAVSKSPFGKLRVTTTG
jgi:hypothetical protein